MSGVRAGEDSFASPDSDEQNDKNSENNRRPLASWVVGVIAAVGGVTALVLALAIVAFLFRRKRTPVPAPQSAQPTPPEDQGYGGVPLPEQFALARESYSAAPAMADVAALTPRTQ